MSILSYLDASTTAAYAKRDITGDRWWTVPDEDTLVIDIFINGMMQGQEVYHNDGIKDSLFDLQWQAFEDDENFIGPWEW